MNPEKRPSRPKQVERFFQHISKEYATALGSGSYEGLSDVERNLNQYISRAHNPNYATAGGWNAPTFVTQGGGDVVGNTYVPGMAQLMDQIKQFGEQVKAQHHQLRIDVEDKLRGIRAKS